MQDSKKNGFWWHRITLDLENVLLAFRIQTFMAKVVYTAENPGDYDVSKKALETAQLKHFIEGCGLVCFFFFVLEGGTLLI